LFQVVGYEGVRLIDGQVILSESLYAVLEFNMKDRPIIYLLQIYDCIRMDHIHMEDTVLGIYQVEHMAIVEG